MTVDSDAAVVHFAPALDEPGGIAQVVQSYFDADLRPWRVDFVSIYSTRSRARQLTLFLAALVTLARRPRARLTGIHLHTSNGFDLVRSLLLLIVARRRGLPAVVTVHGSRFMKEVARAPRLVRAIFTRASAVTVLTDEVHDAAVSLGARRVVRLANPVELQAHATGLAERTQVLFAGEIGRRKGVDVLLRAWLEVRAAHPGVSLLLLGPVSEPALLESPPDGVTFGGSLPHAAVVDALASSRLAVLPSRAEAMPMFVLEAMAAGVPVVATDVGAVAATLAGAGIVVPANDAGALASALVELLGDPGRLAELSGTGQRLVSEQLLDRRVPSQRRCAVRERLRIMKRRPVFLVASSGRPSAPARAAEGRAVE